MVSPQAGMQYPAMTPADPTGKILTGAAVLYSLPQAAYTSTVPAGNTFSTQYITNMAVDINLVSFTGGTSPAVNFIVERLGADGNWYSCFAPNVLNFTAALLISNDLGQFSSVFSAPPASAAQHNVPTLQARFRWTFGGSVAPTAVTFAVWVIGR